MSLATRGGAYRTAGPTKGRQATPPLWEGRASASKGRLLLSPGPNAEDTRFTPTAKGLLDEQADDTLDCGLEPGG